MLDMLSPRKQTALALATATTLLCASARAADPFAENVRTTDPLPPEEQLKLSRFPTASKCN